MKKIVIGIAIVMVISVTVLYRIGEEICHEYV